MKKNNLLFLRLLRRIMVEYILVYSFVIGIFLRMLIIDV